MKEERILIAEDDATTLSLLDAYLTSSGYKVDGVDSAEKALVKFAARGYGMVLLDLSLPDEDGIVVAKKIRASSSVPIIMITNRGDDQDKITGLEIGADDYVVKPFNPRELLARIKNTLSRSNSSVSEDHMRSHRIAIGQCLFDHEQMVLVKDDDEILELTLGEYRVLSALIKGKGRVLTRDFLLDAISDNNDEPYYRTVDVIIYRLRKKIEKDPKHPEYLKTVKGLGYRLTY